MQNKQTKIGQEVLRANEIILRKGPGENELPPDWFKLNVWNHFHARPVWELLLDERPSFPGVKEVTCSALIGWICGGTHRPWIRAVTAKAISEFMEAAERKALRNFGKYGIAADMVARYGDIGGRFIQSIYYPVGGIAGLRRFRSNISLQNHGFEKRGEAIEEILLAMQYFDAGFSIKKYKKRPSLSSLEMNARNVGISGHSKFSKTWRKYRDHASIIYAASLMNYEKGTFLQHIKSGEATWGTVRKHLPQLASVAAAVNRAVIVSLEQGATVPYALSAANEANLPADLPKHDLSQRTFVPQMLRLFDEK